MARYYKSVVEVNTRGTKRKQKPFDQDSEAVRMRNMEFSFDRSMKNAGYYTGFDDRRKQEREDAGMIWEDPRAIANLPQQVIMHEYPKSYNYLPEDLDDTLRGVDDQIRFDDRKRDKNLVPKKV